MEATGRPECLKRRLEDLVTLLNWGTFEELKFVKLLKGLL